MLACYPFRLGSVCVSCSSEASLSLLLGVSDRSPPLNFKESKVTKSIAVSHSICSLLVRCSRDQCGKVRCHSSHPAGCANYKCRTTYRPVSQTSSITTPSTIFRTPDNCSRPNLSLLDCFQSSNPSHNRYSSRSRRWNTPSTYPHAGASRYNPTELRWPEVCDT